MSRTLIKSLFASDIDRRIEEVIKVDQTDEEIIRDEIDEYVVTDAIRSHYTHDLRALRARRRTSRTRASASGSPASSAPASRASPRCSASRSRTARSRGERAAERFAQRAGDNTAQGPAQEHQREDPDPRGDLRRLDRPRHPQRQPDAHRDHVRALPPEPRLRQGPGPLRAGDRAREARTGSTSSRRSTQRSSARTGTPRRAWSPSR